METTKQIYKVTDGSYSLAVEGKGLTSISGLAMEGHRYELLADDCVLPTGNCGGHPVPTKNDCIIRDEDGKIIFIRKDFLREIKLHPYCPHCGKHV